MAVLTTSVRPSDERFVANREGLLGLLARRARPRWTSPRQGGGERYLERHRARGRLTARERIELLVDQDSAFLELSTLAAWGTEFHVGASLVTGIGVVSGIECVVTASDPTVRGGAINPYTLRKNLRALEIARVNRLPMVNLVESGGADLPTQGELFVPAGRIFHDLTELSGLGIPTVALVFGNSTAGGAYVPGMCDYAVMVDRHAKVFLGGPPLVKMATGEESDDEELGGAAMHSRVSGLSDYFARDEHDAIRLGREIVGSLNWRKLGPGPSRAADAPALRRRGAARASRPSTSACPFDPREVLARVVDGSRFDEYKPTYGDEPRHRLGVDPRLPRRRPRQRPGRALHGGGEEGDRVHHAREPDRHPARVPAEHDGLHGRSRLRAGGDHQGRREDDQRGDQLDGPAPHRDHGRELRGGELRDVRPGVRAAVPVRLAQLEDGGDGAPAARRRALDRRAPVRRGRRAGRSTRRPTPIQRAAVEAQIERESHAFFNSARLYDDGIIDPRDTRTVLGIALSAVHSNVVEGRRGYGVFRM